MLEQSSFLKQHSFFDMPSTRKQNVREKRPRQSDQLFNLGYVNMMIGNLLGNECENKSLDWETQVYVTSGELHEGGNMNVEDCRSVMKSNSRENSTGTAETAGLLNPVTQEIR